MKMITVVGGLQYRLNHNSQHGIEVEDVSDILLNSERWMADHNGLPEIKYGKLAGFKVAGKEYYKRMVEDHEADALVSRLMKVYEDEDFNR